VLLLLKLSSEDADGAGWAMPLPSRARRDASKAFGSAAVCLLLLLRLLPQAVRSMRSLLRALRNNAASFSFSDSFAVSDLRRVVALALSLRAELLRLSRLEGLLFMLSGRVGRLR